MKLVFGFLVGFFAVLLTFPVFAADGTSSADFETSSPLQKYFLKKGRLGLAVGQMEYVEPGLMKHTGSLFGVKGGADIIGATSRYIFIDGELLAGNNKYEGRYIDSNQKVEGEMEIFVMEMRGGLGMALVESANTLISLKAGLGFRGYNTDGDHGRGFYRRETTYLFLPIGFEGRVITGMASHLYVGVDYNVFLSGTNTSYFSDVHSENTDQTHKQNDGSGWRAQAGWAFSMNENLVGHIELFYQHWDIAESEKELGYNVNKGLIQSWEPKNKTDIIGISAGLKF